MLDSTDTLAVMDQPITVKTAAAFLGVSPSLVYAHFVTQLLRQGDSAVFKRYSQAKLNMMREALAKLNRGADEQAGISVTV